MISRISAAILTTMVASTMSVGTSSASLEPSAAGSAEIVGMVKKGTGRAQGAVVSITEVAGSYSAPSRVVMNQKDKEFLPHVLAIMKGTTVRFENSDTFFHNVFSSSRVQVFNVGQNNKGDYSDVKFDHVGIVPIKCHIHASMKAYIVVLPNPFFAVTDSSGLFHINGVPAGSYTLKVWAEGGSTTQSITVPASGQAKTIIQL